MEQLKRLLIKTLLLSLMSLCLLPSLFAKPARYYSEAIKVSTRTENDKQAAARTAFASLLSELTGEQFPERTLPRSVSPYIDEFYYQDSNDQLELVFYFNKQQIKKFIADQGKRFWPEKMPLLIWGFNETQHGFQWLNNQTNPELVTQLEDEAARRKLSLISPEPDLNLIESLSGFNQQAVLEEQLPTLSASFSLPVFMSYYLTRLSDDSLRLEAIVHFKDKNHVVMISANSYQALFSEAFEKLIPEIKAQLVVNNQPKQTFLIEIQNIHDPKSYNDIQTTLQSIEAIDNLFLENLSEDSLTYKIETELSAHDLSKTLRKTNRLEFNQSHNNYFIFKLRS